MPGQKGRSIGLILLLLIATAAGFFIPNTENLWFLPLLKGALFVLLAVTAVVTFAQRVRHVAAVTAAPAGHSSRRSPS